jgi:hypothetical protein
MLVLLRRFFSPAKIAAYLSGMILGFAIIFLETKSADSSVLIVEKIANPLLVIYFLLSVFLFVLGTDCLTKRARLPFSMLYSTPMAFIAYHVSILLMDILKMLIYFLGSLTGALLGNTVIF